MIRIFKYRNKNGKTSTKIIAVVGKDAGGFAGISLGKVMLNSEYNIDEVLDTYAGFEELDHIPVGRRGQATPAEEKVGISKFNGAFKRFSNSGVVSVIGSLNCTPENKEAIKKIILSIKSLDTEARKEPEVDTKPEEITFLKNGAVLNKDLHESITPSWLKAFERTYDTVLSKLPGQEEGISNVSYSDFMDAYEKGYKGEELYDEDWEDGDGPDLFDTAEEYDNYRVAYKEGWKEALKSAKRKNFLSMKDTNED